MKLELKTNLGSMQEYYCCLTRDLNKLAGLSEKQIWKHYLLIDNDSVKNGYFAIRIPGGTVGTVYFDINRKITKIVIDKEYVVRTYAPDTEKIMNEKYIGKTIC